jgi:hypothetical protein
MIRDAGFRDVEVINKFKFSVKGQKEQFWHAVFRATP